jgi:AbrB family looped-hinge helix DNA binding protein
MSHNGHQVVVGERGRLVLPSALRAEVGIEAGTRLLLSAEADGSLRLRPYGGGATISSVNLAEVLGSIAQHAFDPTQFAAQLAERGLLHGAITVEPFTTADAVEAGRLRPLTSAAGLARRARLPCGRAQARRSHLYSRPDLERIARPRSSRDDGSGGVAPPR